MVVFTHSILTFSLSDPFHILNTVSDIKCDHEKAQLILSCHLFKIWSMKGQNFKQKLMMMMMMMTERLDR